MTDINAEIEAMNQRLDYIKNTNDVFTGVLMDLISWVNSKELDPASKEEFLRIVAPLETIPDPPDVK